MKFLKWIILTEGELDEQYKIIADRAVTLGYNRAMIKAYDLYAVDERDFYKWATDPQEVLPYDGGQILKIQTPWFKKDEQNPSEVLPYASLTDAIRDNHVDEDGFAHIGEKTPIPQKFLDAFKEEK